MRRTARWMVTRFCGGARGRVRSNSSYSLEFLYLKSTVIRLATPIPRLTLPISTYMVSRQSRTLAAEANCRTRSLLRSRGQRKRPQRARLTRHHRLPPTRPNRRRRTRQSQRVRRSQSGQRTCRWWITARAPSAQAAPISCQIKAGAPVLRRSGSGTTLPTESSTCPLRRPLIPPGLTLHAGGLTVALPEEASGQ